MSLMPLKQWYPLWNAIRREIWRGRFENDANGEKTLKRIGWRRDLYRPVFSSWKKFDEEARAKEFEQRFKQAE